MKFICKNNLYTLSLLQLYYCPVAADDESFASSLILAGFFLFIITMVAFHCYLKRKQRQKFEDNLKRRSIYNRKISTKGSSTETTVGTLE